MVELTLLLICYSALFDVSHVGMELSLCWQELRPARAQSPTRQAS